MQLKLYRYLTGTMTRQIIQVSALICRRCLSYMVHHQVLVIKHNLMLLRIGSHNLSVLIAKQLANIGFSSLPAILSRLIIVHLALKQPIHASVDYLIDLLVFILINRGHLPDHLE